MKTANLLIIVFCFAHLGLCADTKEKAPQSVIDYANKELVKWGIDKVVVKSVKEQNAKKQTLEQVKAASQSHF